jgi:transcriptional regulator with XRE-family HTH domain
VKLVQPAEQAAARALARRLRLLRERHWPGERITQLQLATALGVSVPLISAWESTRTPTPPPNNRLSAYAAFFATHRSIETDPYRVVPADELTEDERAERDALHEDLFQIRYGAPPMSGPEARRIPLAGPGDAIGGGTWYFPDQKPVSIVCARLPKSMRDKMPYADPQDPDFIRAYTYADLDALIELHGHIRAVNPASQVNIRTADALEEDDYTAHLVLLGGVDWNPVLRDILRRLPIPISQHGRTAADQTYEGYFEAGEGTNVRQFAATLDVHEGRRLLVEDVAHFFRGANPYNSKRTLTICNGLFGRGTYGAVRALTDARFRDRNEVYLRKRFSGQRSYSVLARVLIVNGETLTPDWSEADSRLHEWPEPGAPEQGE